MAINIDTVANTTSYVASYIKYAYDASDTSAFVHS